VEYELLKTIKAFNFKLGEAVVGFDVCVNSAYLGIGLAELVYKRCFNELK
jgi:hypothetical protein